MVGHRKTAPARISYSNTTVIDNVIKTILAQRQDLQNNIAHGRSLPDYPDAELLALCNANVNQRAMIDFLNEKLAPITRELGIDGRAVTYEELHKMQSRSHRRPQPSRANDGQPASRLVRYLAVVWVAQMTGELRLDWMKQIWEEVKDRPELMALVGK